MVPAAQAQRLLIVDDHALVRAGLRQILAEAPDLEVCGEANNAGAALHMVRSQDWDLIILDISLPDQNGLEVLQALKREAPQTKVLVLSMHDESVFAVQALAAGASGYLSKQSVPDQLVRAIRQVAEGKKYIGARAAQELARTIGGEAPDALPHKKLPRRELQVLCLIAAGKGPRDIAGRLELSVKTVSTYRARMLRKMGLKNNAELTHYAARNGLLAISARADGPSLANN